MTACDESKQPLTQQSDPSKFYLILSTTAEIMLINGEERIGRLVSIDYGNDNIEYSAGNQTFDISISDVDRIVFDQTELPADVGDNIAIRGEEQEWLIEPPNSFEISDSENSIAVVPKAHVIKKSRNTVAFTDTYSVNELILSSKDELSAIVLSIQNDE